jgi:RNAse (barnase) inhibitor barstar
MPTPSLRDRLRSTDPPWVLRVVVPGATATPARPELPGDFVVRTIDGRRCRTKAALLGEFARALAFPPHFGRNWDALEDCLTDLEWLPAAGHVIVVTHADQVLAGSPGEYATFIAILETAGREWATPRTTGVPRPARPFHVILAVPARSRRRA